MGIQHFHVAHAHLGHPVKRSAAPPCKSSDFYKTPTMGQVVDSLSPLNISWNPSCLSSSNVDIYLYAPLTGNTRIHLWQGIPTSQGSYNAAIMPRWWNSTASESLQVLIAEANTPPFLASYTSGPLITATYVAPSGTSVPAAADTSIVDSGITAVGNLNTSTSKGLAPGKTAAAVLMPLLVVFLAIGVYFKMQRAKGREKRKRWSEAVDKRMSTISGDWKSVSAAGATAAIRNSMAVSNRNSVFSLGGALRPVSMAVDASESGQAGVGAAQRPGLRTGVGLRNPNAISIASTDRVSRVSFAADTRTSRVSFANDPRPSGESRRTRAFHSAYVPPVPSLPTGIQGSADETQDNGSDDHSDADSPVMSPTQTAGPLTLTPEDIRARIASGHARAAAAATERERQSESEMDEVMPALSMMVTGTEGNGAETDDYLFTPPTPPTPAYSKPSTTYPTLPTTPVSPMSPMAMDTGMAMPSSTMSPDEMLRAYAKRKKSSMISKKTTISYPKPIATASAGIRQLFSPTSAVVSPTNTGDGYVSPTATGNDEGSIHSGMSASEVGYGTAYAGYDYARSRTSVISPLGNTNLGGVGFGHQAYGQQPMTTGEYGHQVYGQQPMTTGEYGHQVYGQQPMTTGEYGHQATNSGSIGVGAYGGAQYAIGEDEDIGAQRHYAYGGPI